MIYLRLLLISIITIIPTSRMTAMDNNARSSVDSPAIQSLSAKVHDAENSSSTWDRWYMRGVYLTAFVILLSALFQHLSNRAKDQLTKALSDLNSEKEKQLTLNLRDKDIKISAADERAGIANKEAGRANETAGKANERAGKLEKEAAEARQATEELRKANIISGEKLEEEKRKRLALAVSLLPRSFRDQSGAIPILKVHRSITAVFSVSELDAEALDFAKQIYFVLELAGWRLVKATPTTGEAWREGVFIHPGFERLPISSPNLTLEERFAGLEELRRNENDTRAAAQALMDVLVRSGVEAQIGYPEPLKRSVIIRVGKKPNRELKRALKELGEIPATPLSGVSMGGNSSWFPK